MGAMLSNSCLHPHAAARFRVTAFMAETFEFDMQVSPLIMHTMNPVVCPSAQSHRFCGTPAPHNQLTWPLRNVYCSSVLSITIRREHCTADVILS